MRAPLGQKFSGGSAPRAALRLPWAMLGSPLRGFQSASLTSILLKFGMLLVLYRLTKNRYDPAARWSATEREVRPRCEDVA